MAHDYFNHQGEVNRNRSPIDWSHVSVNLVPGLLQRAHVKAALGIGAISAQCYVSLALH